jgi:dimethylhistidine N-methyltransferase
MGNMATIDQSQADVAALSVDEFRHSVITGLANEPKRIPCKYLYDERGAKLFEAICELEEYYPTQTELGILSRNAEEIADLAGTHCNFVDLGSGSGMKMRVLLNAFDAPASYIPVDVARKQLLACAQEFSEVHPQIAVHPVCADYTHAIELPVPAFNAGRTIVFFPGSTIGNFEPWEAAGFLRRMTEACGPNTRLLIGVDLQKSKRVLDRAYNDPKGITAAFNRNLLVRANRELDADFELRYFRHHAFYNQVLERIEMHLVSRHRQVVSINGTCFDFETDEPIVTEHSYKYTVSGFQRLALNAGLNPVRCWTDDKQWFSVHWLRPTAG